MRLLERLNKISPKICRLVARKDRGQNPMSHSDIAKAAGLSRSTVVAMSKLDRWDKVPLDKIDAYTRACGVDLLSPKMSLVITRKKMGFLKNSNAAQRRMYSRLIPLGATAANGVTTVQS